MQPDTLKAIPVKQCTFYDAMDSQKKKKKKN
jgi:hypothetical protein